MDEASRNDSHAEGDAFRWVETWKKAGPELERIRREELRNVDNYAAIQLLLGHFDHSKPPFAPDPDSGLVEQQRLFMKAVRRS